MKIKSLAIAVVMAVGLFVYGYLLSTAGHDHASHGEVESVGGHHAPSASDGEHDNHDH